jgi:hypothetical protein
VEVAALRCRQHISMPTTPAAFSTIPSNRRAPCAAIETWSSWLAEVGIESTLAGKARCLFSETSAAAVTCGIMKPEFRPGLRRQEGRQS